MKDKTLHMIGNAHLDPVWLWPWTEGFQEAKATFRSALDRIAETEEFVFTSSSAAIYAWIEGNEPRMLDEIRQRVEEGRWYIAGGWWIQPDCNIPGGEAFVRQGLYGQRYFKEKLGVTATVGYNVDSFGHHGMLPQILRKSGLPHYVFMRPNPAEKDLPAPLFWWEADDGSRVLTFRIPFTYCTWGNDLEEHIRRCQGEFTPSLGQIMCFYGVGNHGGGPTRENIRSIQRLMDDPELPTLRFSTPGDYFASLSAEEHAALPVVHDDLQHHARGCYAAHSGVKRWNRQAENLLLTAERFATIAADVTGQTYPQDFAHAWKQVLFNQFHDILAGTSIKEAYDDARDLYGEALSIAKRNLNDAIQSISWNIHIDHEDGARPIVVFNPHAWPARVPVEFEFGSRDGHERLFDHQGQAVTMQWIQPAATVSGWRRRLCFMADLPPLGYRVYVLRDGAAALQAEPEAASAHSIENQRFRLAIDPATGCVASLFDKQHATEVFSGQAAVPVVIHDPSDTWSHDLRAYTDVVGHFEVVSVELIASGPVRSTLRVSSRFGASRLTQDFMLHEGRDQVDVHVTVDWREQWKMLKLRFPVAHATGQATYEIPYGTIERPTHGEEESGQSWIDVGGRLPDNDLGYGLSILNDGKYSFDVRDNDIGLTVLRSPVYAHHDPRVPDPEEEYDFIDQGIQQFRYTLLPHTGTWADAETVRRAAELNQPAIALAESVHAGPLPHLASFVDVDRPNIIVNVVKRAEDGDDVILRCYETARVATSATIRLHAWNRTIETSFGACEIKTLRVPRDPAQAAVEVSMIEWQE